MPPTDNGWNEWSKHVLAEIIRLDKSIIILGDKVDRLRTEMAMLKVKSGVWGALAGAIPAAIVVLYTFVK